jgi:hypothetical protein
MEETIAEILKVLGITVEKLASFVNTTPEYIANLRTRCCHANMDPVARRLYALERVADLLSIFMAGDDIQEPDLLGVLQNAKITIDVENHQEEEGQKFYQCSLLELINIDPLNNYWFPLTEVAVGVYLNKKDKMSKAEMN